ncbi:hypothetical protein HGRIS_011442 [Hohenbuehelia grisea]|uniref:Alpha/beta hydrolase fold-3 domain-containing protein n=1 Tax=Hohenbuehelia grisea TaxID=104357 RepID=A0ABR3JW26_9AGAR
MIYDKTPHYAHHADLPYAKEPWKSLYVYQRLFTTLLLVPYWALYYLLTPRSWRPRPSWNLRQIIFVFFTRRIFKVTEVAGVTWGTRNPESEPKPGELKETRFEWVEPLADTLRCGIINDDRVPYAKVGVYIWPKEPPLPPTTSSASAPSSASSDQPVDGKPPSTTDTGSSDTVVDVESSAADVPIIGVFFHGGGYTHMSAHEKSRTSRIPRNLVKQKMMSEVYGAEYRLLQFAPFPAVVQDAAAVYAHVVKKHNREKGKCKIVLIGDSSGGNLALALARWIRDEARLPMPDGLLLLSPSCDTSHAIPQTHSSYVPRPNAETDYLVDTIEPRALLQTTFLGFKYYPPRHHIHLNPDERHHEEERKLMEVVHSEYVSVASPRVLHRWGHEIAQHDVDPTNPGEQDRGPEVDTASVRDRRRLDKKTKSIPMQFSCVAVPDPDADDLPVREANLDTPGVESPYRKTGRFPTLFSGFPRTRIVIGDAERLVREVSSLTKAMERDGVDVQTDWVPDAVHDLLIIAEGWWDEPARAKVWKGIDEWMKGF